MDELLWAPQPSAVTIYVICVSLCKSYVSACQHILVDIYYRGLEKKRSVDFSTYLRPQLMISKTLEMGGKRP